MKEVERFEGVWKKLEELGMCRRSWKSWACVEEVERVGHV